MNEPPNPEVAVFATALELPADQRGAYLDKACADDIALRRRVEALLRVHDDAGEFFDKLAAASHPAAAAGAVPDPRDTIRLFSIPPEKAGDRIGRYKLLQQIGEGGCGVVYMAEQEEPVRRRVALKVIKLGMDTRSVIARFEAERQALALMDHPNIAKVLDAGATDTGRPYFVMELVRGVKITDYCDENSLSTRERLGLFIQVCQAIQHAHQKGIIHRDIKPSNILVADHDGVSVPKVIDFGIAKATTDLRLTDKTLFTAFEQFIGTPAYMSPEQAKLSGADIDTRSDIYSLGVLLYELLTSHTPFAAKRLLEMGLDEICRIIREEEPLRPSTRLQTLDAAEQTTVARNRQCEPPRLFGIIHGDLDWIVMKALDKDRTRRYETANGLAVDVQRHLKSEPVVACPPSNLYKFQKLVRRNRLVFAAAGLLAASLLAATTISGWEAIRATRAEKLAAGRLIESENARQEAEAISKFLTEIFQSPDPVRNGRSITVAEILGTAARKLETDLTNQPARQAAVQATLGKTFEALGLWREAIPLQEKARDSYLAAHGAENINTLKVMQDLAISYDTAGRKAEALQSREQVLRLCRKVLGPEHLDTLSAMSALSNSYQTADRQEEALKLREQVVLLRRKLLGPEHPDTISAMHNLANSYFYTARWEEALSLRHQVLNLRRKVNGPEHPGTLMAMSCLADSYDEAGRREELINLREQLVPLYRKVFGPEHPDTVDAMVSLANAYDEVGRREEALQVREQLVPLSRKVLGPEHPDTYTAMADLARSYYASGRDNEAIALLTKFCNANPKDTDISLTLAIWQTWSGQDAAYEATRLLLVQQAEGTDQAATAERASKAFCLRPATEPALLAKALALAQRGVELGKTNSLLPYYRLALGLAEYRNGQYANAERTLSVAEQTIGQAPQMLGIARLFRVMSVFRQNRAEEARNLFTQAEAEMPPLPADERTPLLDGSLPQHDVLICWLAFKEAKALIDAPSTPIDEPSRAK